MSSQTAITTTTNPVRAVFHRVGAFLRGVAETIGDASHVARCANEAERLFEMSDAELARRGLKRDQIIQHAFRSYLHL
jgi:hypothetical protein